MRKRRLLAASIPFFIATAFAAMPAQAGLGAGVGKIPQGTQTDTNYAHSYAKYGVTNVFATTQKVSCYRPEVPFFTQGTDPSGNVYDGYTGMQACPGATTGEDTGATAYPNQAGSAPGYPAAGPMLVNDHSESDIRVDPSNPNHLIGSVKWFASAEGYNHLEGFYESWDGGKTWPVQGHIPGYEGFTDNTDPVGAFDGYGNFYEILLPYQFAYFGGATGGGGKLYQKSNEPNPAMPSEAVSVSVHPARAAAAAKATDWISTHTNAAGVTGPDFILMDDNQGQEPDKEWIAIDANPNSPHFNTIYAMFVTFSFAGTTARAYVSTAKALPGGQHTDWTPLQRLPTLSGTAADTYLLPHVDPSGVVWTSVTNFPSRQSKSTVNIAVDYSADGGMTWNGPLSVPGAQKVVFPPEDYDNTTFTDGIENTFGVGPTKVNGHYPIYVSWEDYSAGKTNVILSGSFDGGLTWSDPIQVNDNVASVDEFQPNLAVAANGTVSVNFYDRRLACPGSSDSGAGLALDTYNPHYSGALPPYGASNYCVNTSVQFYSPTLAPIGHNIRLSQHTWDPQLNAPWRFGSGLFSGKDTFLGDYFGNDFAGTTNLASSVSTYDDGSNPHHYQQQVIARVAIP
ncbi:MAG TPA: sialidase family protein [Candidatus Dormibacteraeota bacterium]